MPSFRRLPIILAATLLPLGCIPVPPTQSISADTQPANGSDQETSRGALGHWMATFDLPPEHTQATTTDEAIYALTSSRRGFTLDVITKDGDRLHQSEYGNFEVERFAHLGLSVIKGEIFLLGGGNGITYRFRHPNQVTAHHHHYDATYRSSYLTVRDRVYQIGGFNREVEDLPSPILQVHDPLQKRRDHQFDLPTPRDQMALAHLDGRIYVIGGNEIEVTRPTAVNTVEAYDIATNRWETKAGLPTARTGLAAVVLDGKIYAFGGHDGRTILDTVEVYDPAADRWSKADPMPAARTNFAAGTLEGQIYLLGGTGPDGQAWRSGATPYAP